MKIFFVTWLGTLSGLNGIIARNRTSKNKTSERSNSKLDTVLAPFE
jgi:hypothetical protein